MLSLIKVLKHTRQYRHMYRHEYMHKQSNSTSTNSKKTLCKIEMRSFSVPQLELPTDKRKLNCLVN